MILSRLILHHLKYGDDDEFYRLQAQDALRWMEADCGLKLGPQTRVLDLGCGHGVFGMQFALRGCAVTFSDYRGDALRPEHRRLPFKLFEVGKGDLGELGRYDLVLFSNVFEHMPNPDGFLRDLHKVLTPGGVMFLSWTNWLSPWGGHDFSPFHYLGPRLGPKIFDFLRPGKRVHRPFDGLYPTYIGRTLRDIARLPDIKILKIAPRYYTELAWLMRIPVAREFLAWNCALLIEQTL